MIAFPRQKDPAFLARIQLAVVTFDRHPKSKDTTRHGLALRLFVTAGVLAMSAPIFGQETVPSVFPSTQVGTVQPVPDASIPPSVDLTIPSIDAGTAPSTSTTSETPLIPQEAPQSTPAIQPAAVQGQDSVDLGQNPPAPLPQPEAALPPINADEMADDDRDELLRGPVHEAFAEQFNADPVPGLVVPQKPPEAIEEVPPELKPDGRQVEWISGYWAWDEDQDDFIWVSGVWREIPQGFRWLPGYWTEVEGGYQWVSGTWVSTQTSEIDYLNDAPPETLEQGQLVLLRQTNTSGFRGHGCGATLATYGVPAIGRWATRTGFGYRLGTSGLREDTTSATATGTIRWLAEASCLLHRTSIDDSDTVGSRDSRLELLWHRTC